MLRSAVYFSGDLAVADARIAEAAGTGVLSGGGTNALTFSMSLIGKKIR